MEEAVVNALIHRDYTTTGTNIFIYIYDDRVEIINPGRLLPPMTPRTFGKMSLRRNEIIADVFSRTSYVEKVASGIKRIKDLCKEENIKVKYTFDGFIELVLYKNKISTDTLKKEEYSPVEIKKKNSVETMPKTMIKTMTKTMPKTRIKIIELINNKPDITREEIAKKLKLTLRGIDWHIKVLKAEQVIERVGANKGGYWKIKK